ncbi:MAG: putative bifunctional diguanylate cyclase/phosphodiesterase, partial [Actinomycetota bacterium]
QVFMHVSVGVAFSDQGDESPEDLLRNADLAMYSAKSSGGNDFELFQSSMHLAVMKRLELLDELRIALEEDQLAVYFQPVVELCSGRIVGAEALVRWVHPERGLIPPIEFIPAAEESGLIVQLGAAVLAKACEQLGSWQASGIVPPDFSVSVNLSPAQVLGDDLAKVVAHSATANGVDPAALTLEITEGALMQDTDATIARLQELKRLDVRLAIDDFGTGYSSLSYLRRFPIDILKVDKSFVDGISEGGGDPALVHAVLKLGQALGVQTIVEGIELSEQRDLLLQLGCSHGQGYLYSAPVPPDEFASLLQVEELWSATAARSLPEVPTH